VVSAHNPAYSPTQQAITCAMLLLVLSITYLLLRSADLIDRWIGRTGSLILSRVMGIILAAIATETILSALGRLNQ
jgi:multiple antibiotic resistance protein